MELGATTKQLTDTLVELVSVWGLRVIGAIAVLVIGRIIASALRRGTSRGLSRAGTDETLIPFLSGIVYYIVSNLERIGGFQVILLVLASLAGAVELFLIGYSVFYLLVLPGYLVNQLYSLRHCHEY